MITLRENEQRVKMTRDSDESLKNELIHHSVEPVDWTEQISLRSSIKDDKSSFCRLHSDGKNDSIIIKA